MRAPRHWSNLFFAKKWLVILIIAIILTIFGRIVDNKSLTQSGIVIGIGIDYADEKYQVTVQAVGVSGSAGSDKSSTNYLTYTAKGQTISEAINILSEKLGLIISLSHCNLVVMSRSALLLNPIRTFSALTKPLALPEQALIVATDHDIPQLFASKIPSMENISFFLQAVLLQDLGAGGLTTISVKDFLALRCSRSKGVALPYLQLVEMTEKPITDGASNGDEKIYYVDINKNLVVNDSTTVVIDENMAKSVNMFLHSKVKDKLAIKLPEGQVVEFRIVSNNRRLAVDGYDVFADMKMKVSFVEAQGFDTPYVLNCNSKEVLYAKTQLEKLLAGWLVDSYLLSKSCGVDFLGLENLVYQKMGRNLDADCFDHISFSAKYEIEVTENS